MKHIIQKLTRGYSDKELWGLDFTIAKFVYPRLKAFKRSRRFGFPAELSEEKWEKTLDKMILAFELLCEIEGETIVPKEYLENEKTIDKYFESEKKIDEGLKLFGKYFRNLWD